MTYASDFPRPVAASAFDPAARRRTSTRGRKANVGYVLFAFGALWVMAIAMALGASPKSLLDCQPTVLGDTAVCESSAAQTAGFDAAGPGLNVSSMAIPAGLAAPSYDAF